MRLFKCAPFADVEVDLDDPKTYEYLPNTAEELRQKMFSEIGFYYTYVNCWHKDIFDKHDGGQKKRVEKLIENFAANEKQNYGNLMWYKEQIFLFQDETENMC